jgi:hypothetical protein
MVMSDKTTVPSRVENEIYAITISSSEIDSTYARPANWVTRVGVACFNPPQADWGMGSR